MDLQTGVVWNSRLGQVLLLIHPCQEKELQQEQKEKRKKTIERKIRITTVS